MSWVDQINTGFVRWLHRDRGAPEITVSASGITVADKMLHFADLTALRAGRRDVFAGDQSYLLLAFAAGEVVEITEADAAWAQAIAALDASGRTRAPSREWLVELLATAPGAAPNVIALR